MPMSPPVNGQFPPIHAGQPVTVYHDLAGTGVVDTRYQIKQGGLAGAGGPQDATTSAGLTSRRTRAVFLSPPVQIIPRMPE